MGPVTVMKAVSVATMDRWGGSISNAGNGGGPTITNSILVTTSADGPNCYFYGPGLTDGGGNFSTDPSCGFRGGTTFVGDLALGALADNGGATQTIALLSGSVAINAGINATCVAAPVSGLDQRGTGRPQGAACDSGAYEAPAPSDGTPPSAVPTKTPPANSAGWNQTDVTVSWNWSDSGSGVDPAHCTLSSTSAGEGSQTVSASCTDLAGNTRSASYGVNVDKTTPTVTATATRVLLQLPSYGHWRHW